MNPRTRTTFLTLVTAATLAAACSTPEPPPPAPTAPPAPPPVVVDQAVLASFSPLPAVMESADNPITPEKTQLGRMLFHETRISRNHDVSCNSCHVLTGYGVDGRPKSPGHKGQLGGRNSPTVYNAAGHVAQFWDGRAATIEEQAKGPVLNPVEMAMPSPDHVLKVLTSMPEYADAFAKAFPGEKNPVTYDNFGKAVGAFERQLVTPSRWDEFLAGDQAALTDDEKKGFNTFVSTGCVACHSGAYVGGGMFQKLGVVAPWPELDDEGRFAVTKNEADKFFFKVPSLRNIEKTAPCFHDGKTATLEQAVKLMARHQLGKELSDGDTASIVTWLRSLTGDLPPAEFIAAPALPASTARTPRPDAS